jgi:hypothetical protein
MTPDEMRDAVTAAISRRIAAADAKGNKAGHVKWAAELRLLTTDDHVKTLAGIGFDPAKLDHLAVYATMKIRRIVAQMAGTGKVDPYTEVLVRNALAVVPGQAMPNGMMTASLNAKRVSAVMLPVRRSGTEGTASTQASSSRAALQALGAGVASGRAFTINQSHPAITAIAGSQEDPA